MEGQEVAEEKNEEITAGGRKERAKSRGVDTDMFGYPVAKSISMFESERKTDIFGHPISKSVLPKSFVGVSKANKLEEPDQDGLAIEAYFKK